MIVVDIANLEQPWQLWVLLELVKLLCYQYWLKKVIRRSKLTDRLPPIMLTIQKNNSIHLLPLSIKMISLTKH